MKIKILSVGKVKQTFILEGEQEYVKRLAPFANVSIVEVGAKVPTQSPPEVVMKKEGDALLRLVGDRDFLIVLDEHGTTHTSKEFADVLNKQCGRGVSQFVLAIGGAYGWDDAVKKRASHLWSLSPLTFTYQMTRLIVAEQLYRALSIIKGSPYHKE